MVAPQEDAMNNDKKTPQITTAKMVTRGDKKKGMQETDSRSKSSCSSKKCTKDQHHAKTTEGPSDSKKTTKSIGKVFTKKIIFHTDEEWESMLQNSMERTEKERCENENQTEMKNIQSLIKQSMEELEHYMFVIQTLQMRE